MYLGPICRFKIWGERKENDLVTVDDCSIQIKYHAIFGNLTSSDHGLLILKTCSIIYANFVFTSTTNLQRSMILIRWALLFLYLPSPYMAYAPTMSMSIQFTDWYTVQCIRVQCTRIGSNLIAPFWVALCENLWSRPSGKLGKISFDYDTISQLNLACTIHRTITFYMAFHISHHSPSKLWILAELLWIKAEVFRFHT